VFSQKHPNFGTCAANPRFPQDEAGAMEIIVINDGALRRPLGEEFVRNALLEQVSLAFRVTEPRSTDYAFITPPTSARPVHRCPSFVHDAHPVPHATYAAAFPSMNDGTSSAAHGDHTNGLVKRRHLDVSAAKIHVPTTEMAYWMT
jgi:hypothetical protein